MSDLEKTIKAYLESYDFHLYPHTGMKAHVPFIAEEDLVFSGQDVFEKTFCLLDEEVKFQWYFEQGDLVLSGQTLCLVEVSLATLLKAEKVIYDLLGRLCGLATYIRGFKNQTLSTKSQVLCSHLRPFSPLEKQALCHGGGVESSSFLIDTSFINYYSSLSNAVEVLRRKSYCPPLIVEVSNKQELEEALRVSVEGVLLDESTLKEGYEIIPKECFVQVKVGSSLELAQRIVKQFEPDFICLSYKEACSVKTSFLFGRLQKQSLEAYL